MKKTFNYVHSMQEKDYNPRMQTKEISKQLNEFQKPKEGNTL